MMCSDWKTLFPVISVLSILLQSTRGSLVNSAFNDSMSGPCRIFCGGKVLHYIQMSRIFNDSAHFVKMKMKKSPDEIENKFNNLLASSNGPPSKSDLNLFVTENFIDAGTEFDAWNPEDWKLMPKFIYDVYDLKLRNWVKDLNSRWKSLGRKISKDVKDSELYSLIYLPNPYIAPGGRFMEMYYWDSYWIIEGLLLSEMENTAKGMIENFIFLVDKYGYVPNGNRKYYLGRSQPPLLIPMVDLYFQYTKDSRFLAEVMDSLEKEFSFWNDNRSVEIVVDDVAHKLYHYKVSSTSPRSESYYEDTLSVNNIGNISEAEKFRLFSEIKAGAETGWDFSTRWFLSGEEHTVNISDIQVSSIAPVCLNSLMGFNAKLLSEFFGILGNVEKQNMYEKFAKRANSTMSRIFWSERDGIWLDYHIELEQLIPGFYPSNLIPLWTETFGEERDRDFVIEQAIAYLDRNHVKDYPGGIPASLIDSGQQWDMPNGWAPLQYFVVMGLHKAGKYNEQAKELSFKLAHDWILNVYQAYINSSSHAMFEKYDVKEHGTRGGGGEYKVQEGFGWTNAVVMKFLSIYGHKIRTQDIFDPAPTAVGLILMLVTVVSIVSYMRRVQTCRRLTWKVEEV